MKSAAWLLFGVYLAWRYAALGRLGGYASMQYDPLPMLLGFLHVVRDLLVPWLWSRPDGGVLPWLAAAPILAAVVWHLSCARRWRPFAAALAMFALACVPMAPFFVSHENPHLLRYYCLPCAALAGLLAAPWRTLPLFVLAAWALPMVAVRTSVHDTDRWTRAQHTALLQVAATPVEEPLFVAGLPTNTAFAVAFHYGADRLLAPPFTPALHRIYPLRPVVPVAAPFRIDDGEASATGPLALPLGSVWWFRGTADAPGELLRGTAVSPLPDLPITGDRDGTVDLSSTRLAAMEAAQVGDRLVTGIAPVAFHRVTIFTALGYFACIVPDHARAGEPHGVIDLLQFFAGERAIGVPADQARATFATYAPGDAFVMRGLEVPTTHDLSTDFPVLIEACSVQGDRLVPTHRSQRLLRFQFDRGYAQWVRRALNL